MLNQVVHEVTTGTKQLSKEQKLGKTAYVAGIVGFLNILCVSLLMYTISVYDVQEKSVVTVHAI
jgi:hypothetical protein